MYQRKDALYRKAKGEGLRSRAAFKLEDLDRRLLRPGDRVLDLGCWPGGWLQVASRRVGDAGRVVGVDLRRLEPIAAANVRLVQGDVAEEGTIEAIDHALEGPADLVLSDLSPSLSGIRDRDEARASELVRMALGVAERVLRRGGTLVCKVFMNSEYREMRELIHGRFADISATRSRATRKGSAELYVIGRGFRGGGVSSS
ncbi:MAG TPA: RlmE family RNA methyltransferase [Candidatus Binatia bacterium]|nr:RlmE family RNA methyltransferase [Candidatus Binatia bacterium]